jgi:hypothetical protein
MVKRLLPLILVLLAGCAFSPPFLSAPAVPVEVDVPVFEPVYCQPPRSTRPALPIASLTPASAPADTLRAYAATIILLKGLVRERDALIAGCSEPVSAPPGPPPGGKAGDSVRVTQTSAARD